MADGNKNNLIDMKGKPGKVTWYKMLKRLMSVDVIEPEKTRWKDKILSFQPTLWLSSAVDVHLHLLKCW